VFGDTQHLAPDDVKKLWSQIKAEEKALRAKERAAAGLAAEKGADSVLDGVPPALPALTRALKLQEKAGRVGFDWNDARQVLAKIREECDEIDAELAAGDSDATAAEIGDLLFAVVNLARHADADPETALRRTNAKFTRRFAYIEAVLRADGRAPAGSSLEEMDRLWTEAKIAEKGDIES
jgi:ATP diphosphatase